MNVAKLGQDIARHSVTQETIILLGAHNNMRRIVN
jgi:hypothetical protein